MDESGIRRIVSAQQEGLEREIGELKLEAQCKAEEAWELADEVPF